MSTTTVPWRDTIKKEARGVNDLDLGEVQETGTYYVHTQRGIGSKTQFYIPKRMFRNYDGHTVHFDIAENDANQFVGNKFPSDEEYRAKYERPTMEKPMGPSNAEYNDMERIPIMTERIEVSKHMHTDEVTITKTPYMETRTMDVPVMHEEIRIEEARPASGTKVPEVRRDLNEETIKIPVRHEDVDVRRTPEVKEELVIHRTPVTETRRISEDVRSERFEVTDKTKATLEEEKKKHSVA
ncbi:MAG: YsnF/AvaK domain-containing protein [Candidatus Bathyarchaeota archaeon]|nr:YsnF/AvaK domain-containing protein [Candidatus Bathyarchaeota archaeon]